MINLGRNGSGKIFAFMFHSNAESRTENSGPFHHPSDVLLTAQINRFLVPPKQKTLADEAMFVVFRMFL